MAGYLACNFGASYIDGTPRPLLSSSSPFPSLSPLSLLFLWNVNNYLKDSIQWCSPFPRKLRNLAGSAVCSTGNRPSTQGITLLSSFLSFFLLILNLLRLGYYYQALILLSVGTNDSMPKTKKIKKRKAEDWAN
jgi:hypothetical protein